MQNKMIVLSLIFLCSCSSWLYPNEQGKTDEERLYNRVKEHWKNERYTIAYKTIVDFEKEFPNSTYLCELKEYKGDARAMHEYFKQAIEDYSQALAACKKNNDKSRADSLGNKISDMQKKIK